MAGKRPPLPVHAGNQDLTLDIASVVFMGHEPGSDHELVTRIKAAYETTTGPEGDHPHPVPPFKWWRGLQARKVLEDYFVERVKEKRGSEGTDMLTVLTHIADGTATPSPTPTSSTT